MECFYFQISIIVKKERMHHASFSSLYDLPYHRVLPQATIKYLYNRNKVLTSVHNASDCAICNQTKLHFSASHKNSHKRESYFKTSNFYTLIFTMGTFYYCKCIYTTVALQNVQNGLVYLRKKLFFKQNDIKL